MDPITLKASFVALESDRRLAGDAIAGHEDAFAALFESHRQEVYRTGLAILGNREAALDAVQETFIKVHRGLNRWRGESSLRTWIVRIAIRCAIDLKRRSSRNQEALPALPEPSHDPRGEIEMSLRISRVQSLAEHLTGQSGLILRLRLFAGHSNKEIAVHLGLSEANVRVQITNAVRRLKAML